MKRKKRLEFSKEIKQKIIERSKNRCERCGFIFEEPQIGEFHHIKAVVFGGDASFDNCTLLCKKCHAEAPNVKNDMDFLVYKHFFLRFASFKEAIQYYKTEDKLELYFKIAQDIAKIHYNTK
jgi:hypothetical protein